MKARFSSSALLRESLCSRGSSHLNEEATIVAPQRPPQSLSPLSAPVRSVLMGALADCKAHPEDLGRRLILADWLEEHGDESDRARGELIRLEVQMHNLTSLDAGWFALSRQAKVLNDRWQNVWRAPLGTIATVSKVEVACGLLTLTSDVARFLTPTTTKVAETEAYGWVRGLQIERLHDSDIAALLDSPLLNGITHLGLGSRWSAHLTERAMQALTKSSRLSQLVGLHLDGQRVSAEGIKALVRSPSCVSLRELSLRDVYFGTEGVKALMRSPHLAELRELRLGSNRWLGPDMDEFRSTPSPLRVGGGGFSSQLLSRSNKELTTTHKRFWQPLAALALLLFVGPLRADNPATEVRALAVDVKKLLDGHDETSIAIGAIIHKKDDPGPPSSAEAVFTHLLGEELRRLKIDVNQKAKLTIRGTSRLVEDEDSSLAAMTLEVEFVNKDGEEVGGLKVKARGIFGDAAIAHGAGLSLPFAPGGSDKERDKKIRDVYGKPQTFIDKGKTIIRSEEKSLFGIEGLVKEKGEFVPRQSTEKKGLAYAKIARNEVYAVRIINFDGDSPYGGAAKAIDLGRTCKVGSYKPNKLGLNDRHGNVWEWCSDWYDAECYTNANTPKRDPQGPPKGVYRVVRGGAGTTSAGTAGRRTAAGARRGTGTAALASGSP